MPFPTDELHLPAARPPAGVVDVWTVPVFQTEHRLRALETFLTEQERTRARRLQRSSARARFLVGRFALRRLLGAYLGLSPGDVRLAYDGNGKPHLGSGALQFSLSHAGNQVLIGAALERRVGVDLERERACRWERIAARVFPHATRRLLGSVAPADQPLVFLHAWTQREAFVKAVGGRVLSSRDPLTFLWPLLPGPQVQWASWQGQRSRWTVLTPPVPPGYIATVVAEGEILAFRCGPFPTAGWPTE